jgi:enoyl-CoA hydratase/carnithine racemase
MSGSGEERVLPNGLVRTRREGRVRWLVLQCPPANAYSYEMMRDLDEAVLAARMDEEADVIVLTGEGERFFCAGADIAMLARVTAPWKYYFCLHANETLQRLEQTPKLVIAALNGHCMGGGLEVALAADLRVARRAPPGAKPFQIGMPEVKLGVLPGTGGTQRLARLVGASRAIEWLAEARTFDADGALAAGLVNRAFEASGFTGQVQKYAESFTAPDAAALAVGHIKRAVQSGAELPLASGLALERELQQRLFESADAQEGIAAFVAKRAPRFSGK